MSTIAPVNIGATFTLDLTVEEVTDLAGWQLDVAFNPAVLSTVSVEEGDFLKKNGENTFFQESNIDNTLGKITGISGAFIGNGGVSGPGTLLSINLTLVKSIRKQMSTVMERLIFST